MKVLQINTVCSYGSTGRNAVEIAEHLKKFGVDTYIAYGQKTSDYEGSKFFSFKLENKIHSLLSRITGLQGVYSYFGTGKLLKYIKQLKPDIIHLNNLHGNYLNIPLLFRYIGKNHIPVVYTIHDCWAYTGNCAHYVPSGCTKWLNGCGKCSQKEYYPPSIIDNSRLMFNIKSKAYHTIKNMTLVPVSKWIGKELSKSMLSFANISPIYNWVDIETFSPNKNRKELEHFGVELDTKYILGVCGRWSYEKGATDWIKLAETIDSDCKIVLIGNNDNLTVPDNIKDRFILVPYVSNQNTLATFYCCAEAFLNLSHAESFGKTTAEALSCGCPVIVYNTTACPELVGDSCGYVSTYRDVSSVIDNLNKIFNSDRNEYQINCREFAVANFSKETNIEKYLDVYKKCISR